MSSTYNINSNNMSNNKDFVIPEAKEVKAIVSEKKSIKMDAKKKKQLLQYKDNLKQISQVIAEMVENASTCTEYFIDNGDMNGPIDDYDLCKGGEVVCMISDYLEGKGYFLKIEEGKFKQIHRYGTYITISVNPFPEEDYGYDDEY